ncbi:DUF1376 domain-containing protein [Mesorhizobium waimense]|uniref:DUF1376 domain-containing protein n=2 Tax=Mesorhizobium waimense TaxID=1300307 RepID=A0A3A5K6D4_9HYPH|nr:DUF1376 domain-containing protein [Mesorhizobium waimense]
MRRDQGKPLDQSEVDMTDLAWMKVYIGTETALTGHLSAEEFGAYERLRRHYWQHGSLPEDDTRLMRVIGVEADRWQGVAKAVGPLIAEGLRRLDLERSEAASKRERKVAAGRKGAEARWQIDGKTNANANGTTIAAAIAEPSVCQWPSASASEEVRYEDKVAPTPARARDPIPLFCSDAQARQWLLAHDVFPGDLDGLARKMVDGDLVWSDIEPSAA